MDGWNTSFLLGWPIVRCYVSFRECICLCHSLSLHVFYTWLYTCSLHHIKSASNLSCHSSVRIIWVPNQWSATLLADAQCCWPSKSSKITRHEECSNFAIILFDLLSLLLRCSVLISRVVGHSGSSVPVLLKNMVWLCEAYKTHWLRGAKVQFTWCTNKSPRHGNSKRNIHN